MRVQYGRFWCEKNILVTTGTVRPLTIVSFPNRDMGLYINEMGRTYFTRRACAVTRVLYLHIFWGRWWWELPFSVSSSHPFVLVKKPITTSNFLKEEHLPNGFVPSCGHFPAQRIFLTLDQFDLGRVSWVFRFYMLLQHDDTHCKTQMLSVLSDSTSYSELCTQTLLGHVLSVYDRPSDLIPFSQIQRSIKPSSRPPKMPSWPCISSTWWLLARTCQTSMEPLTRAILLRKFVWEAWWEKLP